MIQRVTRYVGEDGLDYPTLEAAITADKTNWLLETIRDIVNEAWCGGCDEDDIINALMDNKEELRDALTRRHPEEPVLTMSPPEDLVDATSRIPE